MCESAKLACGCCPLAIEEVALGWQSLAEVENVLA
jgi:hypothetical protein